MNRKIESFKPSITPKSRNSKATIYKLYVRLDTKIIICYIITFPYLLIHSTHRCKALLAIALNYSFTTGSNIMVFQFVLGVKSSDVKKYRPDSDADQISTNENSLEHSDNAQADSFNIELERENRKPILDKS